MVKKIKFIDTDYNAKSIKVPNIDKQIIGMKRVGNRGKNDLDLNWPEAKRRYPRMKAYADKDNDRYPNALDCTPLDPNRDGFFSNLASAAKTFGHAVVTTAKQVLSVPTKVISKTVTAATPAVSSAATTVKTTIQKGATTVGNAVAEAAIIPTKVIQSAITLTPEPPPAVYTPPPLTCQPPANIQITQAARPAPAPFP